MLSMPAQSEVATFSGTADKGVRQAAAALVIQDAFRMYRHHQKVKVSVFSLMSPPPITVCKQKAGLSCWLAVSLQVLSAPMWSTGQETVVSYKPAMAQHHPEMEGTCQTAAAAAGSN